MDGLLRSPNIRRIESCHYSRNSIKRGMVFPTTQLDESGRCSFCISMGHLVSGTRLDIYDSKKFLVVPDCWFFGVL
jgi:hypothetical protein